MSYKLKTTGIATNLTMLIAIDPDTGTVKDFCSSAVTADITVGANVTLSSQSWDGRTRHYWKKSSAGTTDDYHVKFGTNKPSFVIGNTGSSLTWVAVCELSSATTPPVVFGSSSSNYLSCQNVGGSSTTYPCAVRQSVAHHGGQAQPSNGTSVIFGVDMTPGASGVANAAYGVATDSAMTVVTAAGTPPTSASSTTLTYIGRDTASTNNNTDTKWFAAMIFNKALSQAEWDSLVDDGAGGDWFNVLLEVDATAPTLSTPTVSSVTSTGATVGVPQIGQANWRFR